MSEVVAAAPKFGRKLREDFLFKDGYVNINHGSFGTYPKPVKTSLLHWQALAEASPDEFIRFTYHDALRESRAAIAELLGAPYETCVFVPNATTGVNTILRNLTFDEGDVIVDFATIYGACGNTVRYVCETTKARSARVQYTYPIEDDELVRRFRDVVAKEREARSSVRVAIFDTVVTNPGVTMPFERLTEACHELGVMSLIDGAHGVGMVDLNLSKLDPDFFVSNCHKWLLTPRASAVFYCPVRNQHLMRSTLPTSWGLPPLPGAAAAFSPPMGSGGPAKSAFEKNFGFIGSGDFSPYLCVPAAIGYRDTVLGGEAAIREYCETLAREGGQRAAQILGTEVLDNSTHTMTQCFFANIRLPLSLTHCRDIAARAPLVQGPVVEKEKVPGLVTGWIARITTTEYNGFQAVFEYGDGWYLRLSAMVYLEMADFEWAAGVLKEVCGRVEKGEWLAL